MKIDDLAVVRAKLGHPPVESQVAQSAAHRRVAAEEAIPGLVDDDLSDRCVVAVQAPRRDEMRRHHLHLDVANRPIRVDARCRHGEDALDRRAHAGGGRLRQTAAQECLDQAVQLNGVTLPVNLGQGQRADLGERRAE